LHIIDGVVGDSFVESIAATSRRVNRRGSIAGGLEGMLDCIVSIVGSCGLGCGIVEGRSEVVVGWEERVSRRSGGVGDSRCGSGGGRSSSSSSNGSWVSSSGMVEGE